MKALEKKQALELRLNGKSIKEIAKLLGVAKSSVSLWVRNVELTEYQKKYLKEKGLLKEKIERSRNTRLLNEKIKRDLIINPAIESVPEIDDEKLWLIGVMLYWGEGSKTRRAVRFANSDPDLIKMMMLFFRYICEVPESKFRGYIHIHEHLNYRAAELYWSKITDIPLSQFLKTYRKPNKSSQNKKDTLPYGTLDVYVYDAQLFYKIVGWSRGISIRLLNESLGSFSPDRNI